MADLTKALKSVASIVNEFGFSAIRPTLDACRGLIDDGAIDIAVLGQFKSGKSSLLNTLIGRDLFPVGVIPVTAVVTRVTQGSPQQLRVTDADGSTTTADLALLADFVTEARNPHNQKHVAIVDALIDVPTLSPGVRLVDTPGLGSVFAHNSEATLDWLPHASIGLVVVSADRPFSAADRQLVADARRTAPRVVVVLNKVDLLTESEQIEVSQYIQHSLDAYFDAPLPVLPFSSRAETAKWVEQLRQQVIEPVVTNLAEERKRSVALKLETARHACQGYLQIALSAAEKDEHERDQLRKAIFTETVQRSYIEDELRLAADHVIRQARPAFENVVKANQIELQQRLRGSLAEAFPDWQGNLAIQADYYRNWLRQRLLAELTPLSTQSCDLAEKLARDAERRFERILTAFRDRIGQNIEKAIGMKLPPISWDPAKPRLNVVPVAVSNPFMTNWELLWWILPMRLVGGVFYRHLQGRIPWEVDKNLSRLVSDWCELAQSAVNQLRAEALDWVTTELETLKQSLQQSPTTAAEIRDALELLARTD
jgi:GTP-binding protein EngB required for normal cell division